MRTIRDYLLEDMNIEMPEGNINGEWFVENGLPMIVACTSCGMTMALPSALVDEDGCICCSSCAD